MKDKILGILINGFIYSLSNKGKDLWNVRIKDYLIINKNIINTFVSNHAN